MKKVEVFEGNQLYDECQSINSDSARCFLRGRNSSGRELQIPITDELFSKHMLFIGGIGTGKTNALFQIVQQLRQTISSDDIMMIFDTKGDFHREFFRNGDVVISNDEKATGVEVVDFWNLFLEIERDEHMDENITEIAKTLFFEHIDQSQQPFFPNAAKDIFAALITHIMRGNSEYEPTNNGLRELLDQADANQIRAILTAHKDLKAISSYISGDKSEQTQGVLSELQQLAHEMLLGNFMKPGNISIRRLIREKQGRVVFVEYDLGIGNMLTPIYRLLFDLAIKEALCRRKSEGNVWFIVDEFRLLPHLQHAEDAVNFGRGLGVKFIIGVQNVDQLFASYGEPLAKSILSGFQTNVSFRVGDSTTRDFIKHIHGTNRKKETYSSAISSRGIVENIRDANVVEDWDISRLRTGEAIIGFPEKDPFRFVFKRF